MKQKTYLDKLMENKEFKEKFEEEYKEMTNINQELIDCEIKGNMVRLYLGKNGEQWGDDWNDKPYEHNAGRVYDEYVEKIADISTNFNFEVREPANFTKSDSVFENTNSDWRREDFIKGKIYAFTVINPENNSSIMIYFGEKLEDIIKRLNKIKAGYSVYIAK